MKLSEIIDQFGDLTVDIQNLADFQMGPAHLIEDGVSQITIRTREEMTQGNHAGWLVWVPLKALHDGQRMRAKEKASARDPA